jgi:hypothetical protein
MSMEEETRKGRCSRGTGGGSIEPIAEDRMADTRQVHPYLMRPAGSDADAKKSAERKLLEDLIFRKG